MGLTYASLVGPHRGHPPPADRPVVCVQGLGFVGAAVAAAVASATAPDGGPIFNVVGVDLPTPEGRSKASAIDRGRLPFACTDGKLTAALAAAHRRGNLVATTDEAAYEIADVTIVDLPLDLAKREGSTSVDWEPFRAGVRTLGERMPPGSLVIVETTVPPGTCEKVVRPEIERALAARGLPPSAILIAHSFERVMPGEEYLDSILNFWRAYAGCTPDAELACERFLRQVVNSQAYPLTRLPSTTASETAKVLENSYRAVNIALIDEWSRFAEAVGVDLFEVIDVIRRRPTHSNIRRPGLGVGGYCLGKDPLFAAIGARELFGLDLEFPFSALALEVNRFMPMATIEAIQSLLDGGLRGKTLLVLGAAYRPGVADTRNSPTERLVREARSRGARVEVHDPLVRDWPELDLRLPSDIPPPAGTDAIVFAVAHAEYRRLDLLAWLGEARPLLFDANDVLTPEQRAILVQADHRLASIGRGKA